MHRFGYPGLKKILFIMPSLEGGGAERVVLNLLNNLSREKYSLTIALFQKRGAYIKSLNDDVELIDLKCKRLRYSFFKIYSLLRKQKPDIVFIGLLPFASALAVIKYFLPTNIRFIFRETTAVGLHYRGWLIQSKLGRYFLKRIYTKFDVVICQSKSMYNEIHSKYNVDSRKLIIINNPLSIQFNSSKLDNILKKKKYRIVSVGRLSYEKGYDVLLKSMKKLIEYGLSIDCFILGEGEEEVKLKALSNKLNLNEAVTFLGFKDNPHVYLLSSDFYVFCSRYDGFPNAVLEALACGIPVVALNAPGGISEIIENGKNGWLIDDLTDQGLANGIKHAIHNRINKSDIIESSKRYDLRKIIANYEEVFDRVLMSNK